VTDRGQDPMPPVGQPPAGNRLRHGVRGGDPSKAPRCGARARRTGAPCRQPAMPNGRCRMHGGMSTGPRTPEGLERARKARCKHGLCSAEAKATRRESRAVLKALRQLLASAGQ
jgi:hypothetical protein